MTDVDWVPGLVVLAIGAVAGALIAWQVGRAPRATRVAVAEDMERRDVRGELDALIGQLRELDDLAAKRSPEQLAAERRELELEAARKLRDLERLEARVSASSMEPESRPAPAPAAGSAWKGFFWGAASVGAIAALIFFVVEGSSNREPGGSLTGGIPAAGPPSGPMVNLEALRAAVEQNPENLEARMELARALLFAQDLQGVFEQTQFVLSRNANHPRALSYNALVRLAMGDLETARSMARRAVQIDPSNPEIVVHLAVVELQSGNRPEAERLLEEAIQRFPADARALEALLAELRGSAAEPPAPPMAPSPAVPAGGIAVELLAGAGAPAGGGTVFLFARAADQPEGTPIAVRRVAISALPARAEMTAADSMTGSLPDRVLIEARLDADGDPATVSDPDLSGRAEARPGSAVRIVLSRR